MRYRIPGRRSSRALIASIYKQTAALGKKAGSIAMLDALVETFSDPFDGEHMGITAEDVAEHSQVARERQDVIVLEVSVPRAPLMKDVFASRSGVWRVKACAGVAVFDIEQPVRREITIDDLAKPRLVVRKEGTVTAGDASGANDGAAALAPAIARAAAARGLMPRACVLG